MKNFSYTLHEPDNKQMQNLYQKHFATLPSTHLYAVENVQSLLQQSGGAAVIITANEQTSGVGRPHGSQGRTQWVSEPGNVHASLILPVKAEVCLNFHTIPLYVGAIIVDVVQNILGYSDNITLKPINDILYQGQKVGGILCELPLIDGKHPVRNTRGEMDTVTLRDLLSGLDTGGIIEYYVLIGFALTIKPPGKGGEMERRKYKSLCLTGDHRLHIPCRVAVTFLELRADTVAHYNDLYLKSLEPTLDVPMVAEDSTEIVVKADTLRSIELRTGLCTLETGQVATFSPKLVA